MAANPRARPPMPRKPRARPAKNAKSRVSAKRKPRTRKQSDAAASARELEIAEIVLSDEVGAAQLVEFLSRTRGTLRPTLRGLRAVLTRRAQEIRSGDLGSVERVLTAQLAVLNEFFTCALAEGEKQARLESFTASEPMLHLALQAQAQARETAETLARFPRRRGAT